MPRKGPHKIPTPAEIEAFGGMHCGALYADAKRTRWRCPVCSRTAQECIRWAYISGPSWRAKYGDAKGEAWTIGLHRHHDHGTPARFPVTLICCDCNSADGAAKRKLRLLKDWSFSPAEMRHFVRCVPYRGGADVDYETAQIVYECIKQHGFYTKGLLPILPGWDGVELV